MGRPYNEEVLRGVRALMYNGDSVKSHLVNVLVTAVSWLSIIVVVGGVSSLLRQQYC